MAFDRIRWLTRALMAAVAVAVLARVIAWAAGLYADYALSELPSGPVFNTLNRLLVLGPGPDIIGRVAAWAPVISSALFLIWVYSASRALHDLGEQAMRHTPAMSVVWFFVPFANFVMPYDVLQELWATSHRNGRGSPVVTAWWIALLAGQLVPVLLGAVVGSVVIGGTRLDAWIVRAPFATASILSLIAAVLMIIMVKRISRALACDDWPGSATEVTAEIVPEVSGTH